MDFLTKTVNGVRDFFTTKSLGYDVPTITGGPDILRSLQTWDNNWNDGKRMRTFRSSLYVYACVYKIATKTASIDWELFQIQNLDGDKKQLFVNPVLDLLYKPNPFQTKEEFWTRFMLNKKLAGTAYILKVRNLQGKVVELWNLRPDYMRVIMDAQTVIKCYEFSGPSGVIFFEPNDIIMDSYPDPLHEFGGLSPITPAQSRVDTEDFATKYQRNFFVNNARPDFVLMSERKIGPDQKEQMKEAWDSRHKAGKSQKNVGKGAFLEGGVTYQQVSITQKEMDYIESLKMTRDDILVAFQVPKPVVAITDDVNLANAQTAMEIFLSETIVPEINAITNKLNEFLIATEFDPTLYIGFENPVPDDDKNVADIQDVRIKNGTLLINEAREEFGLEPIVGGWTLYVPIGMQSAGGLTQNGTKEVGAKLSTIRMVNERRLNKKRAEAKAILRGRPAAVKMLRLKKKIRQLLEKEVVAGLIKEEEEPKKKDTRMIRADVREQYGKMVMQKVDTQAELLVDPLNQFFVGQEKRIKKALKLNKAKALVLKGTDYEQRLKDWATEEVSTVAEFVFPFIADYVKSAGQDAMTVVAPAETFDETTARVQKYIKSAAKATGSTTTVTTMDAVASTLAEGIANNEGVLDLSDRVSAVYQDFPDYRSDMIARTTATSANNKGFIESYAQSGVANAKEWIATEDNRTRESHSAQDGEVIGLDEVFDNGCSFPGDPNGDPSETVNCRCVLGPAFSE